LSSNGDGWLLFGTKVVLARSQCSDHARLRKATNLFLIYPTNRDVIQNLDNVLISDELLKIKLENHEPTQPLFFKALAIETKHQLFLILDGIRDIHCRPTHLTLSLTQTR
jgi:hypothetical protein